MHRIILLLLCLVCAAGPAPAVENAAESTARKNWVRDHLGTGSAPVFSFFYGGQSSAQLLPQWIQSPIESSILNHGGTRRTRRWTDPATGLEVRLVSVEYSDYPAVEWTVYLANRGNQPTPLLENIRGIDARFPSLASSTTLRTIRGDNYSASSYEPLEFPLGPEVRHFTPVSGRPTNGSWPYFNLDAGKAGMMLAIGWPGQWQASFTERNGQVHVVGGQQTTHLRLMPGEEIRTPLTALLFWHREDWIMAQNLWRRWYVEHNMPRPGGELPSAQQGVCVGDFPSSAAGCIASLRQYLEQGIRVGYYWMDAGWYRIDDVSKWIDSPGIGSWVPDPKRFPKGIREVSDYVHANGMKFILWFEPERVCFESDLLRDHPEWLLPWEPDNKEYAHIQALNLGNPAARRWLTDYISNFITRDNIDVFRQDANANPLGAWVTADTFDRQGMTENLYVQGYLEFWDTLLQRHPRLLIDSCASGGRRNDLETMRRSVPLLRSDYQGPQLPEQGPKGAMTTDVFSGNQGHTYGLSFWLPYYGTGDMSDDLYSARSHLCPFNVVGTNGRQPNWAALKRQIADQQAAGPSAFHGDYYPLTPYDKSLTCWQAWSFYDPRAGQGHLQAFRRESNIQTDFTVRLRGLEPEARYEITDRDSGTTRQALGRDLMQTGLALYAAAPRTALLFTFRRIPEPGKPTH